MNNNINLSDLKTFIMNKVGYEITKDEAKDLGIKADEFGELANEKDIVELDVALKDDDFSAELANFYVNTKQEQVTTKDKEREKEEQNKVQEDTGSTQA